MRIMEDAQKINSAFLTCNEYDREHEDESRRPARASCTFVALRCWVGFKREVRVPASDVAAPVYVYVHDVVPCVECLEAQDRKHGPENRTEMKGVIFAEQDHEHAACTREWGLMSDNPRKEKSRTRETGNVIYDEEENTDPSHCGQTGEERINNGTKARDSLSNAENTQQP